MKIAELFRKIQYPKLLALSLCIVSAYFLFELHFFQESLKLLGDYGYLSIFLAGFFFAYGFTAPFAVAFFISIAPEVNVFIAAPLAGMGSLSADLLIFQFVKTSFQDEFDRLSLTFFFRRIKNFFDNNLGEKIKKYVLWVIAGILIGSPLPDEFGVSLVSGFMNLDKRIFGMIAYTLNTLGILIILILAQ